MAVFTVHAKNESIIFQRSMQANNNGRKKLPFADYPAVKHPNAANLPLQTYEKNQ